MIALEEEDDGPKGTPAWMATFADLMSLLMCFFVLLLSFSEMDLAEYKRVAGSMREAFGVQNQVRVMDTPKGTNRHGGRRACSLGTARRSHRDGSIR